MGNYPPASGYGTTFAQSVPRPVGNRGTGLHPGIWAPGPQTLELQRSGKIWGESPHPHPNPHRQPLGFGARKGRWRKPQNLSPRFCLSVFLNGFISEHPQGCRALSPVIRVTSTPAQGPWPRPPLPALHHSAGGAGSSPGTCGVPGAVPGTENCFVSLPPPLTHSSPVTPGFVLRPHPEQALCKGRGRPSRADAGSPASSALTGKRGAKAVTRLRLGGPLQGALIVPTPGMRGSKSAQVSAWCRTVNKDCPGPLPPSPRSGPPPCQSGSVSPFHRSGSPLHVLGTCTVGPFGLP